MNALENTITANSTPDYDGWGWDSYWSAEEWVQWHKTLVAAFGKQAANDTWKMAWGKQGAWEHPFNWYKYNRGFTDYFKSQGIDVGWFGSKIITTTGEAVIEVTENVTDAAADLSQGVVSTANVLKIVAPTLLIGIGYYFYKNYIKGNRKINVKGIQI